jgi:hypothetical protein
MSSVIVATSSPSTPESPKYYDVLLAVGDADERWCAARSVQADPGSERSGSLRQARGRNQHHAADSQAQRAEVVHLHTDAYDEAITTPSAESVRRALAIQFNREWGLSMNENSLQGSYTVDELTDLVEAGVLVEFDRITQRGGVLGAMETGYQRGKIQDESMRCEVGGGQYCHNV